MAKINEYVTYVKTFEEENEKQDLAKEFVENLELHNEETCPVLEDVEVPKVLGDTVEAILGAVFIDTGFDLQIVWSCYRKIFPDMDEVVR